MSRAKAEQSTVATPGQNQRRAKQTISFSLVTWCFSLTHIIVYGHALIFMHVNTHQTALVYSTQMSLISMTLSIINSWRARQTLRAKRWSPNCGSKSQTKPLVLWQIWRQICETSIPLSHVVVPTSLCLRQVQLSTQEHMFYVRPLFNSESLVW